MSAVDTVILLARLAVCCLIGVALLGGYRWIRTRSRALARLTAVGFLARATIGVALFWLSYLDVAALRQLHVGNGFWLKVTDAQHYYAIVLEALDKGLGSISDTSPSPAYTRTLTVWMSLVGVSPASGFFLHLTLYVVLGMLVTWWNVRSDRGAALPCLISFGAFTFSPVLLIHGSQPLKDEFFAFLLALASLASLALLVPFVRGRATTGEVRSAWAGLVVLLIATYLVAGVRAYFSFILWGSMVVTLGLFMLWQRPARLLRYVPAAAAILILLWIVAVRGAGPGAEVPVSMARSLLPGWAAALPAAAQGQFPPPVEGTGREAAALASSSIGALREGFENSGGSTNVTSWRQHKPRGSPGQAPAPASAPSDALPRMRTPIDKLTLGLSLLFVPTAVLRYTGLIEVEGGAGLLSVADLDTAFLDLSLLAVLGVLVARRSAARQNLPYLVFILCVAITTACLQAYIITNLGTLFRLRLLVAVPLWMVPLGLLGRKTIASEAQQSLTAGGIGRPSG